MFTAAQWFRRVRRTLTLGVCTLVVPTALGFSGLGYLRAHDPAGTARREQFPEAASLAGATGAAEVCDGRSFCFEFATTSDGPLWVLVQNRGGRAGGRGVLVSRTPGFEDSHAVRAGSPAERRLLHSLQELAIREGGEDIRVQNNLERLCGLITSRQRPCPAPADWYLY